MVKLPSPSNKPASHAISLTPILLSAVKKDTAAKNGDLDHIKQAVVHHMHHAEPLLPVGVLDIFGVQLAEAAILPGGMHPLGVRAVIDPQAVRVPDEHGISILVKMRAARPSRMLQDEGAMRDQELAQPQEAPIGLPPESILRDVEEFGELQGVESRKLGALPEHAPEAILVIPSEPPPLFRGATEAVQEIPGFTNLSVQPRVEDGILVEGGEGIAIHDIAIQDHAMWLQLIHEIEDEVHHGFIVEGDLKIVHNHPDLHAVPA